MGDPEKISQKADSEEKKECYFCKPIKWTAFEVPPKLSKFLYSRKNLFIVVIISVLVYFITFNQPEIVRRTSTIFVFARALCNKRISKIPKKASSWW